MHTSKLCGPTSYFIEGIVFEAISARRCKACPEPYPWSGGFTAKSCRSCDWLKLNNIFAFAQTCPYTPTPQPNKDEVLPDKIEPDTPDTPDTTDTIVDDAEGPQRVFDTLSPLPEKEFNWKPLIIFGLITGPALFLYVLYVCIYRMKRNKRKRAEVEERRQKKEVAGRLETENDLVDGKERVETPGKQRVADCENGNHTPAGIQLTTRIDTQTCMSEQRMITVTEEQCDASVPSAFRLKTVESQSPTASKANQNRLMVA